MSETETQEAESNSSRYTDPILVGCDDGFAAIKLAFFDGTRLVEKSIPSRAAIGANLTSTTTGEDSNSTYVAEDVSYTVSEHVEAQDTRFAAYPTSALNRVLVHHALREAGLGGMRIKLATGLPPGRYYRDGGLNTRLISGKERNMLSPVTPSDGEPVAVIADHKVFSEAAAGLVDYCANDKGETIHAVDAPIAVVDIGGRTTDCVMILPPGNQVDHKRTGSADIGVLDVMDAVRTRLCSEFDLDTIGDRVVDQALHSGKVVLYGRSHDVRSHVDQAIREVSERILRYVQSRFTNAAEVERIVFIGGGAELMSHVIKDFPQAYVSERPQFANARGMLKYLTLMERHK